MPRKDSENKGRKSAGRQNQSISTNGDVTLTVETPSAVFVPNDELKGTIEPAMKARVSLVLTATFAKGKARLSQGPSVVCETTVDLESNKFTLKIPEKMGDEMTIPASFCDDQITVEYKIVVHDSTTNKELRVSVPIQIMVEVPIDETKFGLQRVTNTLKMLKVINKGNVEVGIRIDNPELRPGEILSMKMAYEGEWLRHSLKKVRVLLIRRVEYSMAKDEKDSMVPFTDSLIRCVTNSGSSIHNEDLRIPLAMPIPCVVPSTLRNSVYGNFYRVKYYVAVKVVNGMTSSKKWDFPIFIGTSSEKSDEQFYKQYQLITRHNDKPAQNLHGILFTVKESDWPIDPQIKVESNSGQPRTNTMPTKDSVKSLDKPAEKADEVAETMEVPETAKATEATETQEKPKEEEAAKPAENPTTDDKEEKSEVKVDDKGEAAKPEEKPEADKPEAKPEADKTDVKPETDKVPENPEEKPKDEKPQEIAQAS